MPVTLEFPVPNGLNQFQQYMRLSQIATEMKIAGWRIDTNRLLQHRQSAIERQSRLRAIFTKLACIEDIGRDGQTQKVKAYFWETLGVPVVSVDRKTKKPKLDASALLAYATEYDDERIQKSAAALYGYRKAGKTLSFCDEYLATGERVHATFNVTGTKGSRWSCTGPNLQQLPSRELLYDFGDGPEAIATSLKDVLIADEGFVLVDADWAALELYLQTYIAKIRKLITCIANGTDLHMYNARVMFGEKLVPTFATKKTHKAYRNAAKLAFGFAYNASDSITQVHKTMKGMFPEITEKTVQTLRKRYFAHHPEVPTWQKRSIEKVTRLGYIDTPLMGRRLYLPATMRGFNQSLNSQCQILGGDIANAAIIHLRNNLRWQEGEQIRAQVHDSFVLQTRPEWVEETAAKLVEAMTLPHEVNGVQTKLVAEPGTGYSWGNMKEL